MHLISFQHCILPAVAPGVIQTHGFSLLGRYSVTFRKCKRQNSAEFGRCIVCSLHAGSTPVCGSAYTKHAAGNSIERKRAVWRTSKQNGQLSLLESRALPLSCNSLSLFIFSPAFIFSLYLPMQTMVFPPSSFLKGDTVDMLGAKGNLFCTSSMPCAPLSADGTSIKCETERRAHKDILQ